MKIGFVGEMASGKTVFAEYLINKYKMQKVSFADTLKEDVVFMNLTVDGKIQKPRDRSLLQDYGQLRRGDLEEVKSNNRTLQNINGVFYIDSMSMGSCYPNFWLDIGITKCRGFEKDGKSVVFDDIRFKNEVMALMKDDFVVIKIHASKSKRIERLMARDGHYNEKDFNNISETESQYLPINYMIDNNEDGVENGLAVLDEILKRHYIM